MTKQSCGKWGCDKGATYEKPLCYDHWVEWEEWELEECNRCHWFYSGDDSVRYDMGDYFDEFPYHCDECLGTTLIEQGRPRPWINKTDYENRRVLPHAPIERPIRYVYVMKLSDGKYYVGQTTNLNIRLREHRDGLQSQTNGKDPKLVYFETFEGMRAEVDEREKELTQRNQSGAGRRRIREMIEGFREPLRLLDLEA